MGLFDDIVHGIEDVGRSVSNVVGKIADTVGHTVVDVVEVGGHIIEKMLEPVIPGIEDALKVGATILPAALAAEIPGGNILLESFFRGLGVEASQLTGKAVGLSQPIIDIATAAGEIAGTAYKNATKKITDQVTKTVTSVGDTTTNVSNKITTASNNTTSTVQATGTSIVDKVISDISNFIGGVSNTTSSTISNILQPLTDIANLAENINNNFIKPLVDPIVETYNSIKLLSTSIETSLKQGLTGYIQIPGEIASALGSDAALYKQNTAQVIAANKTIAETLIAGNYPKVASEGLKALVTHLQNYQKLSQVNLNEYTEQTLNESMPFSDASEKAQQWIKDINNGTTWIDKIFQQVFGVIFAGPFWYENLRIALKQQEQDLNKATPIQPLDIGSAVNAVLMGELDGKSAEDEVLRHGVDATRLNLLIEMNRSLLSVSEALQAWKRGIISEDNLNVELEKLKYDPTRVQALKELFYWLPSPQDAARFMARASLSPESFDTILKQNGFTDDQIKLYQQAMYTPVSPGEYTRWWNRLQVADQGFLDKSYNSKVPTQVRDRYESNLNNPQQADLDWLAHWKDMPDFIWLNALYRSLVTKDDFQLAMKQMNYPDEIVDTFIDANRPLIQLWMIPDILASGIMDETEARAYLQRMGFAKTEQDIMINYGHAKGLGKLTQSTDTLKALSLSNLKSMYDDKIIDASQYQNALQTHGYNAEAASLLVDLYNTQNEITARKNTANGLVAQVKTGKITTDSAISQLYSLGFSSGEVAIYIDKIEAVKAEKFKLPTEAKLESMLKDGIITDAEWTDAMQLHGYNDFWTANLLKLITG